MVDCGSSSIGIVADRCISLVDADRACAIEAASVVILVMARGILAGAIVSGKNVIHGFKRDVERGRSWGGGGGRGVVRA